MKLDVTRVLVNLDGKPIQSGDEPLTLRDVLCNALLSSMPNKPIEAKVQVDQYEMALRIRQEDVLTFSLKEAANFQELVARFYTPLITGQVWHILEGDMDVEEGSQDDQYIDEPGV